MIQTLKKMKPYIAAHDECAGDGYKIKDILRDANKARHFMKNTCPLSRHMHMAGEYMIKHGFYGMFEDDPLYMGVSLVESATEIWNLRNRVAELESSLQSLKTEAKRKAA